MNRLSRETFWGPFSFLGFAVALAGFLADRLHKWWMLHVYDITSRGKVEGDDEIIGDGIAFAGVSKYPARVKCALLGWKAFEAAAYDAGAQPAKQD